MLTRAEDAELNAFLLRLQTACGCKVPLSVVVRAALAILMENEDRIAGTAEQVRPQLPSTRWPWASLKSSGEGAWQGRWWEDRD